ncbi:hypothetical protein MATR_13860 [Marivirga tractuosa]|uniref:Lipoprotein n=1 Tax=Marivirga tractuosa (strain ATCC 23168 / DSM 4126 / NBRC 15989 / NCIMB 1408 / VKM B-1430 / H-43) TaxID=643867 RepID=E4TU58_MARTH|nr:hypothetical protein [Marivirga tractuosa]ADR20986.1 hypothetical protein Ftrac_0987 [Marivirga tractuosa DSM 4126]BDD14561.1 hypothetical protein MATR_13860 [Marivirga tractuosa]
MRVLISLLIIGIIGGCAKQSTTSSNSSMENYRKLAYETLEVEPVQFSENSEKDYVLGTYYKNESNATDAGVLKYVIINISEDKVLKKGTLPQGKINWISAYEVEIYSPPGIHKDQFETAEDYKTIYNVKTGKSSNKKGANY